MKRKKGKACSLFMDDLKFAVVKGIFSLFACGESFKSFSLTHDKYDGGFHYRGNILICLHLKELFKNFESKI